MANSVPLDESHAKSLDGRDPLRDRRSLFAFPSELTGPGGRECVYLCGNSLGLMPMAARELVNEELEDWTRLAVEGHLESRRPWLSYHDQFREMGARLVGAASGEVVMMNSLTVNLHLLMASFYRPTTERYRILVEDRAFPSDMHAVASQARFHGFDPEDAVLVARPREGEQTLRTEDIEALFEEHGGSIALVLFGGVNYFSGQLFDLERLVDAGRRAGCIVGLDLAHAAGNVPLRLHDWGVDFAAWCSYKYLNSGPGAVAGAFVHEKHWKKGWRGPRFEGWWGHEERTRFRMAPEFKPGAGVEAWQLSNPPILAMAPLLASLRIFDEVGMAALREKSMRLTGYLEAQIDARLGERVRIITPRDPEARGAQLSLLIEGSARAVRDSLRREGVICDMREPDVIRLAPTPLYNSFYDAWLAVDALDRVLGAGRPA
ncbi:MAG: kynureninase [Phycisphaeraceae bacterium]|nr:MAG: kynureninase [Phycisphaeraceae bacterium]